MHDKYKYPGTYEIKEILSRIASRHFLNDFAQARGIFVPNANQDELAEVLSMLYYDDEDLELIRSEAYQENHTNVLSGFVVESSKPDFNLKNVYESLREYGKQGFGTILNEVVSDESGNRFDYKSSLEYTKNKAGRIEFLQQEVSAFEFFFKDLGNNKWQIEVDSNKSADTKELKKFFMDNLIQSEYNFELLDPDYLTPKGSIDFFDRLAKEGLERNDWRFLDVKHLTIKRASLTPVPSTSDSNDDEYQEFDDEGLTGITQAILEGKNLREDPIVKSWETKNYRFAAMTYEFEHIHTGRYITVKAEFKGRPKVFEVGLTGIYDNTLLTLQKTPASYSVSQNRNLRSEFWNNAKAIFEQLKTYNKYTIPQQKVKKSSKKGK